MMKADLTPKDTSDLIGLVYDSAFEEVQWQSLISRICEMFPGVGGAAYGIEEDTILPAFAGAGTTKSFMSRSHQLAFRNKDNERTADALERTPNGFVTRFKLFVADEEWRKSPFFIENFKPEGFGNSLQMKVDHNGKRSALICFAFPDDPGEEAKLHDPLFEVLKLLAPHTVRASQLARALTLAKRATEAFSGFLDGIILPMIVTDVNGKYLFGNAAGRRVLDRGDPFRQTSQGRVELNDRYETAELYHKLAQTDRDLVQSGMKAETGNSPLMLAISPFRPSMREASAIDKHLLDQERMFAIFVGQSENDAVNTDLLEDVFDLTKREAEVCRSLLVGQGVSAISEAAGRSQKTVRNQIQTIYEKVGVSSNTKLMDRLSVFRTVGMMFENSCNSFQSLG